MSEKENAAVGVITHLSEYVVKSVMFEFNTKELRENFVNSVNDFLSKKDMGPWYVLCDETNNSPVQIGNNEFHAEVGIIRLGRSICVDVSTSGINVYFQPLRDE